jgi:hypothetical protein
MQKVYSPRQQDNTHIAYLLKNIFLKNRARYNSIQLEKGSNSYFSNGYKIYKNSVQYIKGA